MFKATSLINRTNASTLFDINIDGIFHAQLTRDEAMSIVIDYEIKMTADLKECVVFEDKEWIAEIMNWQISPYNENTVLLEIL